jgi:hypothetical protein
MNTIVDIAGIGLGVCPGTAPRRPPQVSSAESPADATTSVAESGDSLPGAGFAAVLAETSAESAADIETSCAAQSSAGLAVVLADALKEETMMMGVTAGGSLSGMPAGYPLLQGQGIEQAILAAAATGEATDAQIALMMLCAMMQSSEDSDFSMLMQMMASMLTRVQGDADALRGDVMSSGYSPFVLDTIDRQVFNTRLPEGSGTGQVILPLEIWRPAMPAFTNIEGERSPELYRSVINQFNVEKAPRYRPHRDGYTYCNIFVWDVTSAMGAEIPHYTDPATGNAKYYPDIKGTSEMGAIAIDEWLRTRGQSYGWREVSAETAQRCANEGKPAVTTAGRTGHVQIVCPSEDGEYDGTRGVTVAQAGSKVTNYAHISDIYGAADPRSVRYFVHE